MNFKIGDNVTAEPLYTSLIITLTYSVHKDLLVLMSVQYS